MSGFLQVILLIACDARNITNELCCNYNSVAMSGIPSEKNNHLVVKSSVNFFSTITHSGSIKVRVNITGVGKGSFQADAELVFEDALIANGKFRFVLPGSFEIT